MNLLVQEDIFKAIRVRLPLEKSDGRSPGLFYMRQMRRCEKKGPGIKPGPFCRSRGPHFCLSVRCNVISPPLTKPPQSNMLIVTVSPASMSLTVPAVIEKPLVVRLMSLYTSPSRDLNFNS